MIEASKRALALSLVLERAGARICAASGAALLASHKGEAVDSYALDCAEKAVYSALDAIREYHRSAVPQSVLVPQ